MFDLRGRASFGHRGIIWANLVEVHLVMLHTQYQGSRHCGFRQEDFFTFSLYKHMLNVWPPGRAIFCTRGTIWTNLVDVYLMMLHTQYQGSRPSGFRQEDFLKFSTWRSIFSLCDLDMQQTRTIWTILVEGTQASFVWNYSKLDQGFRRSYHLSQLLTDGRRMKTDHKSSPCHLVKGELKMAELNFFSQTIYTSRLQMTIKVTKVSWEKVQNFKKSWTF